MRFVSFYIALPVALASVPVTAGEEVLYGPAPDWVEVYDAAHIDSTAKTPLAILDVQQFIDRGTVATFVDQGFKLDSPQALTQAGTSTATWLPDKGDLTIHALQILREGKIVDILASGQKYSVLRRETQLEQRTLDGSLTATMSVPGLRVGDILRISYTQTLSDPTLQGEAQLITPLIAAPAQAGFARQKIMWPVGDDVQWKAGPGVNGAMETTVDGYRIVSIALPLAKRDDIPGDAPARYTRPQVIQAGTFSNWQQVSRIFAPLYASNDVIISDSPLAREVEQIMAASANPVERAALATRLVQDKVSYLMNGLSAGNYVPQAPSDTWDLRYGDCKAKTLLLLSLLDAMGIAAEAVMVNSVVSDAVPDLLPMPAAFDHVLVRAEIEGNTYWLDGTSAGVRMTNIADTPNYANFLPIRANGADLQSLEPRLPGAPSVATDMLLDQRGGVDLPSLVTVKMHMSGARASGIGAMLGQASTEQSKEFIDSWAASLYPGIAVADSSFAHDEESGIAQIEISGIATTPWKTEGARSRQALDKLPSAELSFNPDRGRPSWRTIPVHLGFASLQTFNLRVLLPKGETGFEVRGRPNLELSVGNSRIVRNGVLEGNEARFSERIEALGGELDAAEIAPEKGKAARIANSVPFILAPRDTLKAWQYGKPELRGRLEPYENAYALAIKRDPEEASSFTNRAGFRAGTTDLDGAIEDYNKAIQLDPDPNYYRARGSLYVALGQPEAALADYRLAFDLDPSADRAMNLASILGELGETDEALALVDEFDDYGDRHADFVGVRADILASADRADEGLAALIGLIAERPGQGELLNQACWYQARFSVGIDSMISVCNAAVEQAGLGAATLDSRALAWLQLGEMEKAVADAEAALVLDPDLLQTRYLRAFALRRQGDSSGEEFIRYFAKVWPGLARSYAKYGLKP